uniref:efflux RND transporter permease subunit n=1 Tax=Marinobacterium zhoushanense TaxID=1679163 RepID=UPI003570B401
MIEEIDFDRSSGTLVERVLFNNRLVVVLTCLLVTLVLGYQAFNLRFNSSYEKTIPGHHPFVLAFREHADDLTGLGNAVRVAVETRQGGIYDAAYMETLRKISDELFLVPGVDRRYMKSIWTPNTTWMGVTETGLEGGPVIPRGFKGEPEDLVQLRANVARSGTIGQIVAQDERSSVIYVPLLAQLPDGSELDYSALARTLEDIRNRYQSDDIHIHITGFAKIVGDLIDGLYQILAFFAGAIMLAGAIVFWYTRCIRSTVLVVLSSIIAVTWQLGLLPTLGFVLDPYSILVPFLVFAIGMSHGAQKMNGIMQDVGRGMSKYIAARYTFRRLFIAGLTALLADAVGFAVLLVIDIQVIRELAIAASIGVGVLIFTNLILLPILLSYVGVSPRAAERSLRAETADKLGEAKHPLWRFLDHFTERRWAGRAIVVAVLLAMAGLYTSQSLKIGDLDPGAPELNPDSRYNQDVAFMNSAYGASSDLFAVMVETPKDQCSRYDTLMKLDALEWSLRQLPGVESTNSMAQVTRRVIVGLSEGNFKWNDLVANQAMLNSATTYVPRGVYNDACDLLTLFVYLADHKAGTLERVVDHVAAFAAENNTEDVHFVMAAGRAGIDAATNEVVHNAWNLMLLLVYGAVVLLCFITFRSWRAVVVAILPLMLTSILAEALMVVLGIGVKVATLPVIALGVGIGVDYALYILTVTLTGLRFGQSLSEAYYRALLFTGKVVILTGITLAVGVGTWAWSPIKFQADMGVLLTFMFLWNMLGALILIPALCHFILPELKAPRGQVVAQAD